jgi:hypothetical protein
VSYFIASTDAADTDDGTYPLFWSQEGWTDIKFATKYSEDESKLYSLPTGGVWCTSEDVRYLADDNRGQS